MSELIGKNGYAVGSVEYFKNLNEKSMVGDLLREFCGSSSSTQYSKAVDGVCKRAQDAIYDIHADLKKHAAFLRYFPKSERDSLIQVVKGLEELLKLGTYTRNSTANACVSLLTLQSSETRPKSRESMQNLEAAAKLVRDGGKVRVTYATGYDLIKRAASDGVQRAAGSDLTKQTFFNAVVGNRSKEFVQDLWILMQYQKEKHRLTGRCGKVICSRDYMNKIETQVFGKAQSWVSDCESYYDDIFKGLVMIKDQIILEVRYPTGFLSEKNGNRLLEVEQEFEKLGISMKISDLVKDITHVPTPEEITEKIRTLQHLLNEMKIPGTNGVLKEDGVWGDDTQTAWNTFLQCFENGIAPSLVPINVDPESLSQIEALLSDDPSISELEADIEMDNSLLSVWNESGGRAVTEGIVPSLWYVSPLQSNITGVQIPLDNLNHLKLSDNLRVLRIDGPHPDKYIKLPNVKKKIPIDFCHINTQVPANATPLQSKVLQSLNHMEISPNTYAIFKDLKGTAKVVKHAGRAFLVAGIVMDAYDLGTTIYEDYNDEDGTWGKKSTKKVAEIAGSWAGAAAGAKLGAMAGASLGTVAAPGIGTAVGGFVLGLIGGIAGAIGGEAFCSWVVDITMVE